MQKRLNEIDGIRGWASLVVLIFHLSYEIFGEMFPIYRSFYFKFFLDGPLAVYIFFILSGDAISNSFIVNGNHRSLSKLVLKRYFRLAGPIFLSCIIVYFILKNGFAFNSLAAKIVGRPDWLGAFLPFEASFSAMLRYSLLKVFTEHTVQNSYNPFLWTMSIELYGSLLIFLILFLLRSIKKPFLVISVIILYFWLLGSFYSLFFLGLGFSMLRANNFFEEIKKSKITKYAFAGLLVVVLADAFFERIHYNQAKLSILMAGIIVFLIYSNEKLILFFSNDFSRFLGRVSFTLYICQFSVIISYTSWLIIYFKQAGVLDFSHSLFIIFSSILFTFLIAEIFSRIEKIYLHKLDSIANMLLIDADLIANTSSKKIEPSMQEPVSTAAVPAEV